MFSIKAINDVDTTRKQGEPLAPTKEAQEFRLTQMYGEALSQLQLGRLDQAKNLFQAILQDPISVKAQRDSVTGSGTMLQLRFSTLRNLAETFSKQGADHYDEALECYIKAAAIDGKDVVLWNRLGTLACSVGSLNVARRAFEQGLCCSPRHWSCMEKLAEVLIALGDEAACLSVTRKLLRLSPSHPRALHIQHVIEVHDDQKSEREMEHQESELSQKVHLRGIDLLEPEYFSLSFSTKRKLDTMESQQFSKKSKLHIIDVILPEASWFVLLNAVTDVLKGDTTVRASGSFLSSQIVVSPGGDESNEQKRPVSSMHSGLVNAAVVFSVHQVSPMLIDPTEGRKEEGIVHARNMAQEESEMGSTLNKTHAPGVHEAIVCSGQVLDAFEERHRCKESSANGGSERGEPKYPHLDEKLDGFKPPDACYDWEPPLQERRSTRLERIRSSRRLSKEDEGLSVRDKSKDLSKGLKHLLEPFLLCELASGHSNMFGCPQECLNKDASELTRTPRSMDAGCITVPADGSSIWLQGDGWGEHHQPSLVSEEEEKVVLQFLKEMEINSGIYHVGQQLLERVVASSPRHRKPLSCLLLLDKLTRMWAADRSTRCSLFLAEVYMDMATSTSNDVTATQYFSDCNYNLYRFLESSALQVAASPLRCDQDRTDWENSTCVKGDSNNVRNIERDTSAAESQTQTTELERNVMTNLDSYRQKGLVSVTDATSNKPDSLSNLNSWSFWARFHWLSGRLRMRSGQLEQAYKHFERCKMVIGSQGNTIPGAVVLLPHCKLDNKISVECVRRKLFELQMGNLIKAADKVLEQGQYSDIIDLLAPVLLSGKGRGFGRPILEGGGMERGKTAVFSHELTGLDMLITACEKLRPTNLFLELQCRELRLIILCQAAGMVEVNVGEVIAPSAGLNITNCLDSELDYGQHKWNVDWIKLVADEVKLISRCAALVKEKLDEPGSLVKGAILPPVLGHIQRLLLALMCHFIQALTARKGQTGLANLSLRAQFDGSCFVDSAIAFCRLQHLDPAVSMEQQVALLVTIHNLLAEYGLCCAGKGCEGGEGAFLKMAIKHLGTLALRLVPTTFQKHSSKSNSEPHDFGVKSDGGIPGKTPSHLPENQQSGKTETRSGFRERGQADTAAIDERDVQEADDLDRKRVELGLDCALDQSFFCLYGLNLRGGFEIFDQEGLLEHQNTNRGDYNTKEQCAGVLQYILPYAKACSRPRLVKLRKVLRAVRRQFPCPPALVLAESGIDAFLEDTDFNEDKLREMKASDTNIKHIIQYALAAGQKTGQGCEGTKSLEMKSKTANPTGESEGAEVSAGSTSSQASFVTASSVFSGMEIGRGAARAQLETEPATVEPYKEVYENLYHLLAQVEDMSASEKWAGFVLTNEGEEFIKQNANLFKYDLCYNPLRYESWRKLAKIYDEELDLMLNYVLGASSGRASLRGSQGCQCLAGTMPSRRTPARKLLRSSFPKEVDLLLNDGSKNINAVEWQKRGLLTSRVEISRRRSRRCLMMALTLAITPEQQSEVNELLALGYYDCLQNAVPSYDQLRRMPIRDGNWSSGCQKAFAHFEVAFSLKPRWIHPFYLGKLSEKLGHSTAEALSYYKTACDMNPTAVDPIYRLHASRLKLLCRSNRSDPDVLHIAAQYSFLPSTKQNVHAACQSLISADKATLMQVDSVEKYGDTSSQEGSQPSETGKELPKDSQTCQRDKATVAEFHEEDNQEQLKRAWRVLFEDCIAALQSCLEGELKHFHKARYRIARGLHCRGDDLDSQRAKEELAFCFKTQRSLFTINMWEIDDSLRKARYAVGCRLSLEEGQHKVELCATLAGGNQHINEHLGMPESYRKFITCVRKYLLFYLYLCQETGDVCTLERAYSPLKAVKKFSLCLEDMFGVALGRYIYTLARAIGQADSEGFTSDTFLHLLLEKMFNLYMDYGTSWSDSAGVSLAEAGVLNTPEVAESAICSYIHRYFQLLESDIRFETLEAVHERVRKRFKSPKLVGSLSAQVCRHASLAWCRALCSALCSITPLPPDTPPTISSPFPIPISGDNNGDQEVHLVVDLQEEFSMPTAYEAEHLPTPPCHPAELKEGLFSSNELPFSPRDPQAPGREANKRGTSGGKSNSPLSSPPARLKNVPVVQAALGDLEKATLLLRSTYIFYRDSFSGPFPSGINLFVTGPGNSSQEAVSDAAHVSTPVLPESPPFAAGALEISTPRKLLLWAFALVHGHTGSVAEAVKYCEEQAKRRLKQGQPAVTSTQPPTSVPSSTPERNIDEVVSSDHKQPRTRLNSVERGDETERGKSPLVTGIQVNSNLMDPSNPLTQECHEEFGVNSTVEETTCTSAAAGVPP